MVKIVRFARSAIALVSLCRGPFLWEFCYQLFVVEFATLICLYLGKEPPQNLSFQWEFKSEITSSISRGILFFWGKG